MTQFYHPTRQVGNLVYDPNTLAWVEMTQPGGGVVPNVLENQYTLAFDYDGSGNLVYLGRAAPGTAKSAAGWQIQRLPVDGLNNTTDCQFANGVTAFDQVWNNRASLSYS